MFTMNMHVTKMTGLAQAKAIRYYGTAQCLGALINRFNGGLAMTDSKLKEIEAHAKKRMPEDDGAIATPEHRLASDCLALIKELKSKKKDKKAE